MLREYSRILRKIRTPIRAIFRPVLDDLDVQIRPGMTSLTWASLTIDLYVAGIYKGSSFSSSFIPLLSLPFISLPFISLPFISLPFIPLPFIFLPLFPSVFPSPFSSCLSSPFYILFISILKLLHACFYKHWRNWKI
jgi:Dynein heavy chain, N-terminal region 1